MGCGGWVQIENVNNHRDTHPLTHLGQKWHLAEGLAPSWVLISNIHNLGGSRCPSNSLWQNATEILALRQGWGKSCVSSKYTYTTCVKEAEGEEAPNMPFTSQVAAAAQRASKSFKGICYFWNSIQNISWAVDLARSVSHHLIPNYWQGSLLESPDLKVEDKKLSEWWEATE